MGGLNLLRMMTDVEPLAAINTSFVLVQSLLLGGSSGQTSNRGVSERYLQHFKSPVINASLIVPQQPDNNPPDPDWTSAVDVIPSTDLLMPEWAYQLAAIYLIVISVLGVVMNVTVVIVILNDPQKTPLNWMILNLAFSDGAIAGFGAPMSTVAAMQTGWHFGDKMCIAYAMIMSTAGIGSITTLSALALWRCTLVVSCPAKRPGGFNAGSSPGASGALPAAQATLLLIIIWMYTLAVTLPPLVGWGRYDREAAHISCSVNWETRADNNGFYILYMFALGLAVPLVVIVASYASILHVVRKTGEMKRKTLVSMTNHVTQPSGHDNNNSKPAGAIQPHYQSDAAERRVTIMVACMIGAFLVAWTPYSVLALIETFAEHPELGANHDELPLLKPVVSAISPAVATVPSLFAKTSAIFNPLIYGLLNTQFRSAWARFSHRFLGRDRHHQRHHRHHHHNHGHYARSHNRRNFDNETPQTPTVIAMNDFGDRAPSSVVMYVTQQTGAMALTSIPDPSPPEEDSIDEPAVTPSSSSHSSISNSPFTITTATHFVGFKHFSHELIHPPPDFECVIPSDKDVSIDINEDDQPISLVVVRYLADTVVRCKENDEAPVTELSTSATPSVVTLHPVDNALVDENYDST